MPLQTSQYSNGGSSTGVPTDQLVLHDTVLLNWLTADYDIIPGKSTKVIIASPHRAYAEPHSSQEATQERLTLPRISLQRLEHQRDNTRFNPNLIRKLGMVGQGFSKFRQGNYPVPVNLLYQIDFWCEFVREMNLWEQKLLYQLAYGYKYFEITPDAYWGAKKFNLFLEGGFTDNSDLEPAEQSRQIRRSVTFRAETWLYDQSYPEVNVVKRIELEMYDQDSNTLMDTATPNRTYDLYTASGGTVFTGQSLPFVPVLENTFLLFADFGGTTLVAEDDGSGNLFGTHVASGTIDYTTGAVAITYDTAPDAGTLEASWLTDLD